MQSVVFYLFCIVGICQGFSVHRPGPTLGFSTSTSKTHTVRPVTTLHAAAPKFTFPSQEEAVELGIREWPQQTKVRSEWSEEVQQKQTLVRYILQGTGTVTVTDDSRNKRSEKKNFQPGFMLEVEGPATLDWNKSDNEDVVILTPGFEQGGLFLGAILGLVGLTGALIALS